MNTTEFTAINIQALRAVTNVHTVHARANGYRYTTGTAAAARHAEGRARYEAISNAAEELWNAVLEGKRNGYNYTALADRADMVSRDLADTDTDENPAGGKGLQEELRLQVRNAIRNLDTLTARLRDLAVFENILAA